MKIVAETLPISVPIYEFGSFQVRGQESFADLRPFFNGKEYVGCDMRKGLGVDRILDLHCISLPSESVGTVLILDTLEHVEFPRKAIEEVHRIMKPDGLLVISSVMSCPIHDYPSDYWRFTPNGFDSLLNIFPSRFIVAVGRDDFPHTVVGIGFKSAVSEGCMLEFTKRVEKWKKQGIALPRSLKTLVRLFLPPIILGLYRKCRRA
ncbi:MAG: methyltransferase domain-containing protein [Dehalococcoidia bacterium]